MPSHSTAVVDLTDPPDRLDLGAADVWHLLLTVDGVPRSELVLPGTGGVVEGELLRAAVLAHGDELLAERATIQRLRKRLGETERSYPSRSCSVVVCTHRRPAYVPHVLAALGRLDPAPDEIIIVDNAPGDLDCRAQVEAAGARYVREDRKGLDRARVAGLGAARCELVAFTDDDCVPSPAWLRALPELFDDPAVAAVTGPAFAHSLDDGRAAAVRGLGRVPARLGAPQLRRHDAAPDGGGPDRRRGQHDLPPVGARRPRRRLPARARRRHPDGVGR